MAALIAQLIGASARRPWLVITGASVFCMFAVAFTVRNFAIDTDTAKLIAGDVPFRQREAVVDAAFPHRSDLIVVVIDADAPELAEHAAFALARRLTGDAAHVRNVWRPDGGPFFDRAAWLFAPRAEVAAVAQRLIAAQPLLGTLAQDPSLRGVMDALALMLEGARRDPSTYASLAPSLAALADAFAAVASGQPARFSWSALFRGGAPDPRGLRRFVLVQPVLDYEALEPGGNATGALRDALRALHLADDPRIRVRLTGPVPLADEEFATLADGAALNSALTLAAVVALLWMALRSARLIAAVLASLITGLALTAAFGLLVFGRFNVISVAFAVLFIGLGVDFGIQLCVAYRAKRVSGAPPLSALRNAGAEIGAALLLAAAATAAGFYAFAPTQYRGLSELGVIAGTGMLIALSVTLTLVPALLAVLGPPRERSEVGFPRLAWMDRWVSRRRRAIVAGAALVAAAGLALSPRVEFDFNPLNLRSARVESVATLLDLMRDPYTTPNTIDVLSPTLADAAALAGTIAALPEVDHVVTLDTFVPLRQQETLPLIEDAAFLLDPGLNPAHVRPAPDDAEVARALLGAARSLEQAARAGSGANADPGALRLAAALQRLGHADATLREQAQAALVPGLVTTLDQVRAALAATSVTAASLPTELKRDWVAADGRARIEVFPKGDANDNATLRRFVAAVAAVAPDATGAPVAIRESGRTIVRAFLLAGLYAFIAIVVLLAFALRNATAVALTLAPLLLSGLATLGICVAAGFPLNYANIIALPLMFGIGVAFNIYYVTAWRAGRANLLQSSLTRAVVFSALTTGTAFGSLWLSHHPGTASMGRLLTLSLACTLAAALVFLPALLGMVRPQRADPR